MFYLDAEGYRYINHVNKLAGQNLYFPVELDTEYEHVATLDNFQAPICINITAQCRAITEPIGKIYSFPAIAHLSRHKPIETNFVVWDYLRDLGLQIDLPEARYQDFEKNIPWIQIDCYAYFAIAEFPRVFKDKYDTDYRRILLNTSPRFGVEQGRRLRTFHREGFKYLPWIEMPWIVLINNYPYKVRINICDTSAVQGISSYKKFCGNSNVELIYKDVFTDAEKGNMTKMYEERPDDFDNYALGDLYNYDALIGNANNFKTIYKSLGIEKYYTDPKFTIGSTIANLFASTIKNLFNTDSKDNDTINLFCRYASADYLKNLSTTGALNAKVDGGRCRNNRPIHTYHKGVICDNDIKGCYGDGLRVQTYPLGIPSLLDYPRDTKRNKYLTLKQFLSKYRRYFIPGLWHARISLDDDVYLDNQQDYFASFIPPKSMRNLQTDDVSHGTDKWWEIDNFGESKIFKNEITNGIITHDGLQWLENVASPKLRNELLTKLKVVTAMWYSNKDKVNSIADLLESHRKHQGVNTTEIKYLKRRQRKVSIHEECHKWYGLNLGELLVTKLMQERAKYPKKSPLNNLYKLCVNTIYGDMVSPYFKIGNVVVGNNITARARALAWCMEKGFNGWQTITDGCAFDMNKVTQPQDNRKVNSTNTLHQYLGGSETRIKYLPLTIKGIPLKENQTIEKYYLLTLNFKLIFNNNETLEYSIDEAKKLINKASFEHLQSLFPNLDVLHQKTTDINGNERIGQFEFEVKDFYTEGTFHGSGNYWLYNEDNPKYAMRSYKKGDKDIVAYDGDNLIIDRGKSPAYLFLESLKHPESITRSQVYLKNRILKVGDYRNNYETWRDKRVYPGCTVIEARLLKEFSFGQFTFNTYKQFKSWQRQMMQLQRKYKQSYEMFYIDEVDKLNYQQMINDIEKMIREGLTRYKPSKELRGRHQHRDYDEHINSDCMNLTKIKLNEMYRKLDED